MAFRLALLATLVAVTSEAAAAPALSPEQLRAAIAASSKPRGQTHWWRSESRRLILGFDERWHEVEPSQPSSAIVLQWTSKQGGGLMATCYVESIAGTEVARLTPSQVEARGKAIVDAIVRNGRQRDPNLRLVTWRAARQDNHPVVYVEREMRLETLDDVSAVKLYSLATAWHGYEVSVECASEVPMRYPEMAPIVEQPIHRILNSLQFMRDPG